MLLIVFGVIENILIVNRVILIEVDNMVNLELIFLVVELYIIEVFYLKFEFYIKWFVDLIKFLGFYVIREFVKYVFDVIWGLFIWSFYKDKVYL